MEQNKLFTAEPDLIIGADVMTTRCGLTTTSDEEYFYFCLKNGARRTAFKVNKADVKEPTIHEYIKRIISIYPECTEIYPITKDEYDTIRKYNGEIRRIFNNARKRSVVITNGGVLDKVVEPIATIVNDLLG